MVIFPVFHNHTESKSQSNQNIYRIPDSKYNILELICFGNLTIGKIAIYFHGKYQDDFKQVPVVNGSRNTDGH